ncbi:MAG: hypothetical protein MR705_03715 [Flintibacter sp.]|uniref:hypothetical protein n=1 Tax=Flintibacter sp. TaxID=1918624 RepID=UPI0026711611|nr:hypothetical protein [Flintibacter sp.]MCI6149532.1 hypothetical protein [Flintibacter sp.]MDD7115321.1 hypothetical protein [Flintibacter sp.]MDY5037697.1 hypothetical protein [Lawsonibacter sp.]
MKRAGLLLALLLVLLTGCSSKTPKIDEYTWVMTSVQSMEAGGQAVAYGEGGSSTLEGAKQIELVCEAQGGNLTLTERTNDRTYIGTYQQSQRDSKSTIYEVSVDGTSGVAVAAMTTYQDGTQDSTLIFNLGDYTVNFFAK